MLLLFLASIIGFGTFGILPKQINSALKFLICPAVGLLLFTEFTLFYSFLFNVGVTSIIISIFSEVLVSIAAFKFFRPTLQVESVSIIFVSALAAVIVFSSCVYYFQLLHTTLNGSLETGGGGLYGDTALHLAYTSRIQTGEFPPQNPLFAGKLLVYPYANDLLSAALRINGLAQNYAFILPQLIFLTAFLALFYGFCRKFTSDLGFLISLLLFSFGWGIGFVYFVINYFSKTADIWALDYANNPAYNLHFNNVFTGLIFPERSFLPGLLLVMWIFLNFWEYFRTENKKFLIINSILIGVLPFWHVHTFIFALISSAIFMVYSLVRNFKENIRGAIIFPIISLVLAIPFLILLLNNQSRESFIRFSSEWQPGTNNILIFWLKNSFLTIPLALLGFLKLNNNSRVFFIGPIIAFLVANFVIFQPWNWDNIKLLSLSFLFFAILCGVILSLNFQRNFFFKMAVGIIVALSCFSGLLSVNLQLKQRFIIYDKNDIELADWAKNNSKVDEVFLIDPVPNHPIPGLSGRLVYVGYPGHLWVHGIDYEEREALSKNVIGGNLDLIKSAEIPISYIVLPKNNSINVNSNFRTAFENEKYEVLF